MGITKNRLSEEKIRKLCKNAFPNKDILWIKELIEGMCNAAYDISFVDGTDYILKVAPPNLEGLMTNEINLMDAEVNALNILQKNSTIIVPQVFLYDTTRQFLNSDYFYMSKMEGQNWISVKDSLTDLENKTIYEEVGQIQKILTEIKGRHFGLLGDTKTFDCLYNFVAYLMQNVLSDIEQKDIVIGVSTQEIFERFQRDKIYFEEVVQSSLVHWDMWEGNIFIKNGHVAGVIDWERALWGESYMDDRFRHHSICDAFLRGYGKKQFSLAEKKRMLWYDVYLYLTMMAEVTYRQYEDDGQYQWVKPLFEKSWDAIRNTEK